MGTGECEEVQMVVRLRAAWR